MGFANFYRYFIKGFSQLAALLTALLKKGVRFKWSPEAQTTFEMLKRAFTSAPILIHPDSMKSFLMEADSLSWAIGAILCQASDTANKLHSCSFYSWTLTPFERNYDIWNQEFLMITTAFKEWERLLEGAYHPIQVIMDHNNLEYLETSQKLNLQQVWSLFPFWFHNHISLRSQEPEFRCPVP